MTDENPQRCPGCYDSFSGPWCDNCDTWPCECVGQDKGQRMTYEPTPLVLADVPVNRAAEMSLADAVRVLLEAGIDTGEKYDVVRNAAHQALWTTTEAAAHCEIKPSTWRSYARRWPNGEAGFPRSIGRADNGERVYIADDVRRWHAQRPGSGARTDLTP